MTLLGSMGLGGMAGNNMPIGAGGMHGVNLYPSRM